MKFAQATGVPSCANAPVIALLSVLGIFGCGQAGPQPPVARGMQPERDAASAPESDAVAADGGKASEPVEPSASEPSRPKQGAAEVGYCPGAVVDPKRPPCWDGKPGFCFQCIPEDLLHTRRACVGAPQPEPPQPPSSSPAPAPMRMCQSDGECVFVGDRCEPGGRGTDARGCRPASCSEGARCPAGSVCDAAARETGLPLMAAVPGCRPLRCDEPGGADCGGGLCEPSHPLARFGCRGLDCAGTEPCPAGFQCASNGSGCSPIACHAPGGAACPAGQRCDPSAAGRGCVVIPCDQPGGTVCAPTARCMSGALPGNSGCVPIHCAEAGAPACPAPSKCNPLVWLERGCVECATNADCGCGSCVRGRCYNRPGYCEPGCA